MSAPAPERLPAWLPGRRGDSPHSMCRQAAQLLRDRSAAEFDPDAVRLANLFTAAETALTARPGSVTARMAGRSVSARIVDLARGIVTEHRAAADR